MVGFVFYPIGSLNNPEFLLNIMFVEIHYIIVFRPDTDSISLYFLAKLQTGCANVLLRQ